MYERILRHLKEYGFITSWEAIQEYGCTRLSHYIYMARKNGYIIDNEYVSTKNRFGEHTHFAKYVLKGVDDVGGKQEILLAKVDE